jgi:hypothetical protein
MIHAHPRYFENVSDRFGNSDSNQERTHQARPLGDRDGVDTLEGFSGTTQAFFDNREDGLDVPSGSKLRDNSAIFFVQSDLRCHDAGKDDLPIHHYGGGRFIAGRFDP